MKWLKEFAVLKSLIIFIVNIVGLDLQDLKVTVTLFLMHLLLRLSISYFKKDIDDNYQAIKNKKESNMCAKENKRNIYRKEFIKNFLCYCDHNIVIAIILFLMATLY